MSVKFLSFGEVLKAVSISDDAIDRVNSDLKAYQQSYDVTHLKFLEGKSPTYFNLSNVAGPDLVVIQQDHYRTELPEMKQGMTTEELQNLKVKVIPVEQGMMLVKYFKAACKSITDGGKEIMVTEEIINSIPSNILQELGSFVMTRNTLGEAKKKS